MVQVSGELPDLFALHRSADQEINAAEVFNAIGNSPNTFAVCPTGICTQLGCITGNNVGYDWAVELSCSFCSNPPTVWYVCTVCTNQRKQLISTKMLKLHACRYHKSKKRDFVLLEASESDNRISYTENHISDCPTNSIDCDMFLDPVVPTQQSENAFNLMFRLNINHLSPLSSGFFSYEIQYGQGLAYLTALSVTNNEQFTSLMDPTDVLLHYNIAKLCVSISKDSRNLLSLIFGQIIRKYSPPCASSLLYGITMHGDESPKISSSIPMTPSDLRAAFVDGKFAYLPNIPVPNAKLVGSFVYVSLSSCLAYMMAFGIPIVNLKSTIDESSCHDEVQHLFESSRVTSVLNRLNNTTDMYDIVTYITEWSDGFEPNTSTKSNRGSVYVKSITFARPPNSNFPATCYTYPICIGPSKANRYEVEQKFKEELEMFQNNSQLLFYDAISKCEKRVYLELVCSIQDQPERRTSSFLMLGNANDCPRWGVCLNYSQVHKVVRSCSNCREHLRKGTVVAEAPCCECVNWDDSFENDLLKFSPPVGYPFSCEEMAIGSFSVHPKKLTNSLLLAVVQECYYNLTSGKWSKAQAKAYMKYHGINEKFRAILCNHCESKLPYATLRLPMTWQRTTEVQDHVEATMHLLFLGIVKTVLLDIQFWLKEKKQMALFLKKIDQFLVPIEKLQLSWCKMIPYGTGLFGGHVSENYLAMARILKWFGSIVEVNFSSGNGHSFLLLSPVISSLYAMLSRLLQRTVSKQLCVSASRHIKLFLNNYASMDATMYGEGHLGWISKYNFLSLLNLPTQMENFGPLLNLWEGNFLGEKLITTLKPEISGGLRKKWNLNLCKRVMRKYFFHVMEVKQTTITESNKLNRRFHYVTMEEIKLIQSMNKPYVAEYSLDSGSLYLCFENKENYCAAVAEGTACIVRNECCYHSIEWKRIEDNIRDNHKLLECLLLPLIKLTDEYANEDDGDEVGLEDSHYYYIVTADWKEFDLYFQPSLVKLFGVEYNDSNI